MQEDPTEQLESIADRLDLASLIAGLMGDLKELRAGKITTQQAHARAELARQILRGVHYVVTAQKFLEQQNLKQVSHVEVPEK